MRFTPLTTEELFDTLAALSTKTELQQVQDYLTVNWQFYTPLEVILLTIAIKSLKASFNHEKAI